MIPRRLASLLQTFTFRLGLIYVGLFSLSVIILFTFIYTFATGYLESQIRESIKVQYTYLLNEYRDGGSAAVERRIGELIASDTDASEVYLLADKDSRRLSGNLNEWPPSAPQGAMLEKDGQWVRFAIESAREVERGVQVEALVIPLSKWRYLLVGQSLRGVEKIEQTIVQTFWASLLITLIMALIGALVMTRSVIHRINTINRSAFTIMHGNLSARIPVRLSGDEFDNLSANLNRMLDKIEMLMQGIGQFANNVAHDLRSPLNRIINRVEAGLRGIDAANPARELLEQNIRDMEGLVGTFNSILKISELETNAVARDFVPCDVSAILGDLVELYEPYASERGIKLFNLLGTAMTVVGEPHLLTQALANLLDNAIKFSVPGSEVTVDGGWAHGNAEITIADHGPGIAPEYHARVFEKFFRLELARSTGGNGLGLSLVAAIARIHRIVIKLEDNAPGLKVRLIFPQR